MYIYFFFSSRRRHTRYIGDWSSDVCSSDLDTIHRLDRSDAIERHRCRADVTIGNVGKHHTERREHRDRKSTRLNSSHRCISYAVFCLKKKKKTSRESSSTNDP